MAKKVKKGLLGEYWQIVLMYAAGFFGLGLLLFWKLGTLLPWLSRQEEVSVSVTSFSDIIANPLYFPFKISAMLANQFAGGSVFWLRFGSAVFGLCLVVMFYLLMRKWFTLRIAMISTLLLATSSWFLTYARMATPHILLALAVMTLLSCAWWLKSTSKPGFSLVVIVLAVVACLYVPGMVWIIGCALLFRMRNIKELLSSISIPLKMTTIGLAMILLLPLARAIILDPHVGLELLGWPSHFNPIWFVKEFLYVPFSLVLRSEAEPAFNLGRLPLLDIFSAALLVLGVYLYLLKFGLVRTKVLLAFGVLCSVLIALENSVRIIVLLPVIYAIIAGGISLLIDQWFSVFPTNPIAKSIGVILTTLLITATCFYHINRYFVAWPQAPATKAVYIHTPPD